MGSCNHRAGHIRLNTELVKKPKDLLEYAIVHEMIHLIEPTHTERFIGMLDKHYPTWREARAELNELPLTALEGIEILRPSSLICRTSCGSARSSDFRRCDSAVWPGNVLYREHSGLFSK